MRKITFIIFFICFTIIKTFSQTGIGLDCNQPIDPATGAIQPNATYAVVGTTCTPWVRLNFILGPWSSPSDQTLHSGKTWKQTYDEIVNGFISQGIQVYGLISDQASSNPGDLLQLATPNNQAATDAWITQYVANFVDIVGYFRTRVTTYESYNEPNNWNNGMAVVHSKWFAKILQEVYMETKYYNGHDTDPSWQVTLVSGPIFTHASDNGASYIGSTYSYGINNFDWTWIKNNKGTYPLDGYGMHIYTTQGDSDPAVVIPGMNTNINAFWNSIINYEGSNSKQIWVSEFGWESNAVGYQGQADNLTTGFNLLKNDSRIALAIFFSLTDWPGASWGLYEFGNFATSDQKLSFNAFKNQVSCPANLSPTNLQVTSDCSGAVNFNWTNSGSAWFVDVSTDPNYGTFSNKDVSSLTSTAAPSGFSPSITFLPGTTYYWRIWNGSTHTDGNSFTIPTCVSPSNLQVTADCLGNVSFNWTNTGTGWFVDVSTDAGFATYSNKDVSNLTSINPPSGFSPAFTFLPNTTYYWRVWNGFTHTNGSSFIFQACITPENLQVFIGCSGDVAFNWSNSGSNWMVDVTSDPNFSFYYNASVSNLTTITAPSGFACDIGFAPCTPGSLSFQPNTSYYWRIWNGTTHTNGNSFIVPAPLVTPTITSSGATTFCQGGSITLDAGAGYSTYSWSNGATTQTINVTSSNNYSVTITNEIGCIASSAITTVTVNPLPAAPIITPGGTTTFCQGGSVTIDAGAGYATYSWSNGATSQTINVTGSNTYSVTITDGNGCLASSALTIVTVNPLPAAPIITPGGTTTFCQGGSVTLDAGAGYSNYLWSNSATTQTINVTSSNNYSVTISDGNGCLASSALTIVAVNPLPTAPTIIPSGTTTFCQGASVTLDAGAGYNTYLWSNGATSQTINVISSDNYSVTITDGNGCLASSVLTTVTVNPLPAAPTITPNGTTTFCQGGSVILDAGVGYSAYLWTNGATSQTINVISSDYYSVTITDANGCSASSSITTVTVNPLPAIPTITQNGNVLTSSAANGNQWYINSNLISGDTLQNHTITQIGNYSLTVTDMNGCSSASAIISIITTDIKSEASSITELDALSVYPNPNNGCFTLRFNLLYIPLKITILNLLGEQIYFAYTTNTTGEFTINLHKDNTGIVSQGIYFIQVMAESKMYNLKVICTE